MRTPFSYIRKMAKREKDSSSGSSSNTTTITTTSNTTTMLHEYLVPLNAETPSHIESPEGAKRTAEKRRSGVFYKA